MVNMSLTELQVYHEFLSSKQVMIPRCGKEVDVGLLHPVLFPFQQDITRWAIRKGRCAIFADTGLGKTLMMVEWARQLGECTLIVAPLGVARQTVRLVKRMMGIDIACIRSDSEVRQGINIINYDIVERVDPARFGAVVLDESSILKAMDGKTKQKLIAMFQSTPYRLCCTATPAPNDYIELGNHAEFLGICLEAEMRAMFFVNANKEHTFRENGRTWRRKGSNKGGQEWRLKHHAETSFFRWMASWSMSLTKPSDLGYPDDGFLLPLLTVLPNFVAVEYTPDGTLFFVGLRGIGDRAEVRRRTIDARLDALKELVCGEDQWIIWVGLDDESRVVTDAFSDAIEVKGSDTPECKASAFEAFQDGKYRVLVTKPRIGGFGMNFQNAHQMVFFGLNDSWETWYQCIRRQYRFGQTCPVDVHVLLSDMEEGIYQNVMRKDAMAVRLRQGLIDHIKSYEQEELTMIQPTRSVYQQRTEHGTMWTAMLGDACERLREVTTASVDLSVYSPPFADLYTYTDSERDLGNSRNWEEFFMHYQYIIQEVLRVTKPGRLTCVHTSDIPAMLSRDGWIGVRDFPGEVIRAYESEGWIFFGRAFVDKNPQAQAIRVKSKALLFVQLRKDSSDSRPALVDQVLLFKKPGENTVPVTPVANGELDNETWIEWAHGIWLNIRESDTLRYHGARGEDDEKHICPLQLGTIERCIKLYSNPGEMILTPFGGIGSEGYMAIKLGRNALLIELKQEYFDVAVKNLQRIEAERVCPDLFTSMDEGSCRIMER